MRLHWIGQASALSIGVLLLQLLFTRSVRSLDTRLVESKKIFIESVVSQLFPSSALESSKGENLFESERVRNLAHVPTLIRQVSESFDFPRIIINFVHDSHSLLFEKLGLVKCCHGTGCSASEGCPQIPILQLFGIGQPTFSKCAEEIRPRFMTFSSINPIEAMEVGYDATDMQLNALPYSIDRKVYVLIHGFNDKFHQSGWLRMLRDNMMRGSKTGQPVVLIFDWSRAAQTVFVNKAAASTRTAGLLLALFLYRLHVLHKVSLDRVHLIGHSFGAEIAAVAGRALRKLTGRKLFAITGLDPAGICVTYGGRRPVHCLRYQDAQLVRVLHSDALYFGTASPVGHFDVYLNGGRFQPHCFPHASAIFNPEAAITGLSCSHFRAVRLLLSLYHEYSDCQPIAYECSTYEAFLRGRCATCANQRCTLVGYEEQIGWSGIYRLTPVTPHRRMFIKTEGEPPFCLHHYQVRIHSIVPIHDALVLTGHAHEPVKVRLVNEPTTLLTLPGTRPATRFDQLLLQSLHFPLSSLSVTRIEINYMSHMDASRRAALSVHLCPSRSSPVGTLFRLCSDWTRK